MQIKRIRKALLKVTIMEAVEKSGVSLQTIHRIRTGYPSHPQKRTLDKLIQYIKDNKL